jgi:hypothetical protein
VAATGQERGVVAEHITKAVMAREVNERVVEIARTFGEITPGEQTLLTFVCECTRVECYERVELTRPEYEEARRGGDHYVIRPEHSLEPGEREAARTERYAVVVRRDA